MDPGEFRDLVERAAATGESITFIYDHPVRGLETRALVPDEYEPLRVSLNGDALITGFDQLRKGARQFRVDRIEEVLTYGR